MHMGHLAAGHREMVPLVVGAARQDPDEAEPPDMRDLRRVARGES